MVWKLGRDYEHNPCSMHRTTRLIRTERSLINLQYPTTEIVIAWDFPCGTIPFYCTGKLPSKGQFVSLFFVGRKFAHPPSIVEYSWPSGLRRCI